MNKWLELTKTFKEHCASWSNNHIDHTQFRIKTGKEQNKSNQRQTINYKLTQTLTENNLKQTSKKLNAEFHDNCHTYHKNYQIIWWNSLIM